MIQALRTVLPIKKTEQAKMKKYLRCLRTKEEMETLLQECFSKHQHARARLVAALLDAPVQEYEWVRQKLNITWSVVRALEEKGILAVESERVFRNPVSATKAGRSIVFTPEQEAAIEGFWGDYEAGRRGTYLVYGVTGSGKTEVYMEMIRRVVAQGKQAIVLIPEIALTYQTVMRFYQNFGERVSILNSRLSAGERSDQLQRVKDGAVDVMIGPRSALFTPFSNLGLIVMDEEHEASYKSEQVPRYHARETAIERARLAGASVVLGSATPSMEAMYRAKIGEYQLLRLRNRSRMQEMATVHLVDLRQELREGNRSILSNLLQQAIAERLEKKEQVMLFLNRRGYAGFLSCRACGHVIKCQHCDVSLSSHRNGKLLCHYCGYEEKKPSVCPSCGSRHIGEFRAGTQQIEDLVKQMFPEARVLRMDQDTTRKKEGHEQILAAFANHEADILIGTQMIVKGHDFPNVTLVGILAADMSLYANDYRAGERTFQLLVQAVGRAGRGDKMGEAIIQTYSPEHYAIVAAAAQDYDAFYEQEISYRACMGYPPVDHLMALHVAGEDLQRVEMGCKYLHEYAKRMKKEFEIVIIGPASPGVSKIKDVHRRVLYFKAERYALLVWMKNCLEKYIEVNVGFSSMQIQFDFDPMQMG
jgi:primosomal protein N' (replication factor Y)